MTSLDAGTNGRNALMGNTQTVPGVVRLIAAKEAGELLASPRGLAWLMLLALALSGLTLLFVANTELSLLDNAQVIYAMLAVVTLLGAVLAVVAGADAIAGERERGSLIPLLLAPVSRSALLWGKLGGPLAAWGAMLVLSAPYLWAVGSSGQNLISGSLVLAALGTPVVLGFGFAALGLGARLGSSRAALSLTLTGLFLSAAPFVLGPSLRQSVVGRVFDAVNPISGAFNAYDGVVIDSQSILAQGVHAIPVILWLALSFWFAMRSVIALSR